MSFFKNAKVPVLDKETGGFGGKGHCEDEHEGIEACGDYRESDRRAYDAEGSWEINRGRGTADTADRGTISQRGTKRTGSSLSREGIEPEVSGVVETEGVEDL